MTTVLGPVSQVGQVKECLHFSRAFSPLPGYAQHRASGAARAISSQLLGRPLCPKAPVSLPRCRHALRRQRQPQAMFGNFFRGDMAEKTRKRYQPQVDKINALEPEMQKLSDDDLRARTKALQDRARGGDSLDNLLVETFAVVREASNRVLGLRPFDVQLIGGMILHAGQISEMRTGEGKTLVAIMPAVLNALGGKGVQVVTVNDYLAKRDSEWVGQVPRFLGMSVAVIQSGDEEDSRRKAYRSDITYVTNSELGFDYLRDNLTQGKEGLVQRGFNFCIIDEADSILIDEARTPLIISGPAERPSDKYYKVAKLAAAMERDLHYTVDEKQKSILITEDGYEAAEDVLEVQDLYDPREAWASFLINALNAKELQKKNINYIVQQQNVVIVDEFTGRTMADRRWSEGLHQAVEAKEGVPIQNETVALASISYQNLFRGYKKLAGMTGTANTEADEFNTIYDLAVTVVPPNRAVKREDASDCVFKLDKYKWRNICREIRRMHRQGRPVLVGTTSVERSEELAEMLEEDEIPYRLLNAKPENVEKESEIIAQSGRKGAVTIATNMAGRGTDILLGGNPEFMARLKLRELTMPELVDPKQLRETTARPNVQKMSCEEVSRLWAVAPELFPCQLSADTVSLAQEAVADAKKEWGRQALAEADAEDRLAFACERAPTSDAVTSKLRAAFQSMEREYKAVTDEEKKEVISLGGLHVVGTERHEARRIDNQLRGRSGRQGDPGSTRYFLSLEDNMFRIFGGDRIKGMMGMFQIDDLPIESGMLTRALDEAQRKVESYFFDSRKSLFDYDQVLNTQRDKVYAIRRQALLSDDLSGLMLDFSGRTMDDILEANIDPSKPVEEWQLGSLAAKVAQYCSMMSDLNAEVLFEASKGGDFEALRAYLRKRGSEAYNQKVKDVEEVEGGLMQAAQRFFVLTNTDNLWKEHLQAMRFLQQAIRLRGYAQRDPLVEYKLEGYDLFLGMMAQVRRNVIYNVYLFNPKQAKRKDQPERKQAPKEKETAAAGF